MQVEVLIDITGVDTSSRAAEICRETTDWTSGSLWLFYTNENLVWRKQYTWYMIYEQFRWVILCGKVCLLYLSCHLYLRASAFLQSLIRNKILTTSTNISQMGACLQNFLLLVSNCLKLNHVKGSETLKKQGFQYYPEKLIDFPVIAMNFSEWHNRLKK